MFYEYIGNLLYFQIHIQYRNYLKKFKYYWVIKIFFDIIKYTNIENLIDMNRGFVYLLCDGEKFKIGMTRGKIEKRIAELQTGNPNEIFISSYHETEYPNRVEQMMHVKYKTAQVKNEWFDLSVEQVVGFRKECNKCKTNNIHSEHFNVYINI